MSDEISEENRDLVAYCGLYCGDCFSHRGKVADLARDLRKELRQAKFDRLARGLSKYFKEFEDYEKCYETLGTMVRLRCKRTCRNRGGATFLQDEKMLSKERHRGLLAM